VNANSDELEFNGEEELEQKFYDRSRKEDLGAGMMRGNLSSTLKEVQDELARENEGVESSPQVEATSDQMNDYEQDANEDSNYNIDQDSRDQLDPNSYMGEE
jgi:hypothetical protein